MSTAVAKQKYLGQFFTPSDVAQSLVRWVIERDDDRLLDPSCGDGRFLVHHRRAVGVELDSDNAAIAQRRAPWMKIHNADFFSWAAETHERFEAAAGNPPFIRYQSFAGETREQAFKQAAKLGATFSGLSSSWAPFLVVAAGLLKPGGRMAFVVPAEIGHAPYAAPVLTALCAHFDEVRIIAVREKLFPDLSEDAWLLYARGFGGSTEYVKLGVFDRFQPNYHPTSRQVSLKAWREAGCRLRKFLLPEKTLAIYRHLAAHPAVLRLSVAAKVGIGYVSGANDFFHLRPSQVRRYGIPDRVLRVAVRRAEQLPDAAVDNETVSRWLLQDEPVLLLDLKNATDPGPGLQRYLDSSVGQEVRRGYKCRNRDPWYAVPDVRVPDAFLSYMSGQRPVLVRNDAGCVCTNSLHAVFCKSGYSVRRLQRAWAHPLVDLSCEIEGHPLGGGMLKMEPREASNVCLPYRPMELDRDAEECLIDAAQFMRHWRHYD